MKGWYTIIPTVSYICEDWKRQWYTNMYNLKFRVQISNSKYRAAMLWMFRCSDNVAAHCIYAMRILQRSGSVICCSTLHLCNEDFATQWFSDMLRCSAVVQWDVAVQCNGPVRCCGAVQIGMVQWDVAVQSNKHRCFRWFMSKSLIEVIWS